MKNSGCSAGAPLSWSILPGRLVKFPYSQPASSLSSLVFSFSLLVSFIALLITVTSLHPLKVLFFFYYWFSQPPSSFFCSFPSPRVSSLTLFVTFPSLPLIESFVKPASDELTSSCDQLRRWFSFHQLYYSTEALQLQSWLCWPSLYFLSLFSRLSPLFSLVFPSLFKGHIPTCLSLSPLYTLLSVLPFCFIQGQPVCLWCVLQLLRSTTMMVRSSPGALLNWAPWFRSCLCDPSLNLLSHSLSSSALSLSLSLSLLVSLPTLFIPFTSLHYLQMSWLFHFIQRQSRLFVKSFLAAGINCEGCAPSPGATTQQQCSGCESAEAAHLSTCFLSFLSFSLSLWVLFFSLFVTFFSLDLLKNTVCPIYSMENRACFWCVNYPTGINFEDRTPLPGALLKLSAPAAELLILSPVIPLEVDQWPGWEDLRPSCAFRVWLVLASLRKYREFFSFTLSNSCRFSCLKLFADHARRNTQFIWKTFRANKHNMQLQLKYL